MPLFTVSAGQPIRATHVNQFSRWLTGVTKDITTSITSTHASEYTVTITNEHTSAGNALKVVSGSSTIALFNKTSVTFGAPVALTGVQFGNGTVTAPSVAASAATNTGWYWSSGSTVSLSAAGSERLRVRAGVTYAPGPLQIGTDLSSTGDTAHALYIHKTVSGAYTAATGLVDAFLVEINAATDNDSDIGAVAGFMRAMTATGVNSVRAIAGQLTIDLGAQKADREAGEFGVHNALAITSKADNRTAYDKVFGNVGVLISSYGGTMADGNPAQQPNTAIVVNTFGTSGNWKQFEVFYDVSGVKVWQVQNQGNVVAGGGGNNQAAPAYGFLDTNGDVDTGAGLFRAGVSAFGAAAGSSQVALFSNTIVTLMPAGSTQVTVTTTGANVVGALSVTGAATVTGVATFRTGVTVIGAFSVTGASTVNGLTNNGVDVGNLTIPSALTTSTNNYVPSTGITSAAYQISSTGAVNLTGLSLSQTTAGHRVTLINGGGFTITLIHNSGLSTAPFNTHTGADHSLTAGKSVSLIWTGAVWRFYAVT